MSKEQQIKAVLIECLEAMNATRDPIFLPLILAGRKALEPLPVHYVGANSNIVIGSGIAR